MITKNGNGFFQTYQNPLIAGIQFYHNGKCDVFFVDGNKRSFDVGCEPAFNCQYGIPLNKDGTQLLLGSWEKGISAYSTATGEILWRHRAAQIRQIFAFDEFLIAVRAAKEIMKLDIRTGKELASLRSGTIEDAFFLTENLLLVHSIKGRLSLLEPCSLTVKRSFSKKETNPNGCLSQLVLNAEIRENSLIISGFEAGSFMAPSPPSERCSFRRSFTIS